MSEWPGNTNALIGVEHRVRDAWSDFITTSSGGIADGRHVRTPDSRVRVERRSSLAGYR